MTEPAKMYDFRKLTADTTVEIFRAHADPASFSFRYERIEYDTIIGAITLTDGTELPAAPYFYDCGREEIWLGSTGATIHFNPTGGPVYLQEPVGVPPPRRWMPGSGGPRLLMLVPPERPLLVEAIRMWQRQGWHVDSHDLLERTSLSEGMCDFELKRDHLLVNIMLRKWSSGGGAVSRLLPLGQWEVTVSDRSRRPLSLGSTRVLQKKYRSLRDALTAAEGAVGQAIRRNP